MEIATSRGAVRLGYCTNVHPAETLDDVIETLRVHALPLRRRLAPGRPFGVGLYLAAAVARELEADDRRRAAFRGWLEDEDLDVFTVNAFPFGGFHAARVKEGVYRPDWRERERIEHTIRVGRVLADLRPSGSRTSISTLAGAWVGAIPAADAAPFLSRGLVEVAEAFARIRDETGRHLVICPEPEPLTTLETTADAARFWTDWLPAGRSVVREHVALCFDVCHQAVEMETMTGAVRRLVAAGVPIGKVQLSNALEVTDPNDEAARAALRGFDEPRYLHQTTSRDAGGRVVCASDLPDALADDAWRSRAPWRVHFHVPVDRTEIPPLRTTRPLLLDAIEALAGHADHYEVETYTWDVLPPAERPRGEASLVDGLERELRSMMEALARH